MPHKHLVGAVGEKVAERFLLGQGFKIIDRNYRKKWGEIDIVAKKGKMLRFVEVKTVSREPLHLGKSRKGSNYRPEDNVHPWKIKRLSRAINSYLLEKDVSHETDWQIDLVTVQLDLKSKKARVKMLENIFI